MKYWELIADKLSASGWSWGCVSSTDHEGRQFRVVAAEREDAGRFIVHADERLIAFLELQAAIHRRFEFGWKVMRSSMFCRVTQLKSATRSRG
jgi:hypothetical protein